GSPPRLPHGRRGHHGQSAASRTPSSRAFAKPPAGDGRPRDFHRQLISPPVPPERRAAPPAADRHLLPLGAGTPPGQPPCPRPRERCSWHAPRAAELAPE